MKKLISFVLAALLTCCSQKSSLASNAGEKPIQIHGEVTTEVAGHITEGWQLTKIKNQALLNGTGHLWSFLGYKISGRFYYDRIFDVTDYYPDNVASDQRVEAELRDTYLDYSLGPWDVRFGKQQVVWGEAVGIFMADIVNAKDLREFILPDFDLIRIPEWGTDLEYSQNNIHAEFVFIPGVEFNKLGVAGSEFVPQYPLQSLTTPFVTRDPDKPGFGFQNSKLGGRFSFLLGGLDAGVFYLHSWTESPVPFRTIDSGIYNFDPQYKRLDTIGATFSKAFRDTIIKGEFVFNRDGFFPVSDILDADGIARSDSLNYLIGVDRTLFKRLYVNVQLIQRIISNYQDSFIGEKKFNPSVSFHVGRYFWNRKFETELLMISELQNHDYLYRPKIKCNLTDSLQLSLGCDIFFGQSSGPFGVYRDKSRFYSEVVWKF